MTARLHQSFLILTSETSARTDKDRRSLPPRDPPLSAGPTPHCNLSSRCNPPPRRGRHLPLHHQAQALSAVPPSREPGGIVSSTEGSDRVHYDTMIFGTSLTPTRMNRHRCVVCQNGLCLCEPQCRRAGCRPVPMQPGDGWQSSAGVYSGSLCATMGVFGWLLRGATPIRVAVIQLFLDENEACPMPLLASKYPVPVIRNIICVSQRQLS